MCTRIYFYAGNHAYKNVLHPWRAWTLPCFNAFNTISPLKLIVWEGENRKSYDHRSKVDYCILHLYHPYETHTWASFGSTTSLRGLREQWRPSSKKNKSQQEKKLALPPLRFGFGLPSSAKPSTKGRAPMKILRRPSSRIWKLSQH